MAKKLKWNLILMSLLYLALGIFLLISRVQISKANVFNRDCKKSAPELFKENRARYIQFISILASLFFHSSAYGFLKTGYNFICGKAVSRL